MIAADGGLTQGMLSLAAKLWADNGLKADHRVAIYWEAKAFETGKTDPCVWDELEEKGCLGRDMQATVDSFKDCPLALLSIPMTVTGPNLGAFLLASRHKQIKQWGGKTANGKILYSSSWILQLFQLTDSANLKLNFVSGRPGTAAEVTKKCLLKERNIANTKFRQGEKDETCLLDLEQSDKMDPQGWAVKSRSVYQVFCRHLPRTTLVGQCTECGQESRNRILAVSQSLYNLSITETVPDYGYGARYTTHSGDIVQEVFKSYSKPEVGNVLQYSTVQYSAVQYSTVQYGTVQHGTVQYSTGVQRTAVQNSTVQYSTVQ